MPARKRMNTSRDVAPPRNAHGSVRSAAEIFWWVSSSNVVATALAPRPSSPWHLPHCSVAYTLCPRATLSGELGVGGDAAISLGGVSVNCGDRVLRYATTSRISASDSTRSHDGIDVPYIPWRTERIRSSSVGTVPVSVDRSLYLADVKSRGRGCRCADAGPSPRPESPWHSTQCAS